MSKHIRLLSTLLLALAVSALAGAQSNSSQAVQEALHKGIGPFLATCFVGGLVALLTPCVFPMVPVTVSYFTKREQHHFAGAVSYCVGIISTFAVIGVAASVLFGATGVAKFATNPYVNLGLALLFVVLALNLFGVFELRIPLPAKLANASRSKSSSLVAPFLMGMAFSLTSFTCTAPIAGALLGLSAGGNLAYPALGMTAFGLAFCLPFFFLALFPKMLGSVPKSGQWLGAVKPALGFIELAAAVKFVSNADLVWQLGLLKRPAFLAIWAVLAVGLALYLLGVPKMVAKTGWVRRGLSVVSLAAAAFLVMGMRGGNLDSLDAFLPPAVYPSKGVVSANNPVSDNNPAEPKEVVFLDTYDAAVAKAKAENRNIFVDFTGVTCTNCRWMESNVFVKDNVKDLLRKMVTVQLYTDRQTSSDQANQKLQEKIGGTIALPVYVIVSPEGKVVGTYEGKSPSVDDFVQFLKKGVPGQLAMK